jgi:hypothetical protein
MSWSWRIAIIVALLFWQPILMNARIGQTGAFIAAALAVFVLVYLRNRNLGAILLGLIALKPTAAIGPGLIVLTEKPGVWLRFGIVAAAVLLLPFLLLGPTALFNWIEILLGRGLIDAGAGGHSYNQGISSFLATSRAVRIALGVVLLLAAIGLVRAVDAKMGLHIALAFAILFGALVNPHSLFYDWGIAFAALMLLRKSEILSGPPADLAFGVLAIGLFFAGEYSWETRHQAGDYLRPLTAWSLLVCGTILLATLRRFLEPPEPPPLLATEPSLSSTGESAS